MDKRYEERKAKVLTHYGNGKLACVKCGFSDIRALSIDHINGGGGKHIRSLHKNFYQWLVDNDYPDGFQTLCMNCQFIKREWGGLRKLPNIPRRQTLCKINLDDLSISSLLDWAEQACRRGT